MGMKTPNQVLDSLLWHDNPFFLPTDIGQLLHLLLPSFKKLLEEAKQKEVTVLVGNQAEAMKMINSFRPEKMTLPLNIHHYLPQVYKTTSCFNYVLIMGDLFENYDLSLSAFRNKLLTLMSKSARNMSCFICSTMNNPEISSFLEMNSKIRTGVACCDFRQQTGESLRRKLDTLRKETGSTPPVF